MLFNNRWSSVDRNVKYLGFSWLCVPCNAYNYIFHVQNICYFLLSLNSKTFNCKQHLCKHFLSLKKINYLFVFFCLFLYMLSQIEICHKYKYKCKCLYFWLQTSLIYNLFKIVYKKSKSIINNFWNFRKIWRSGYYRILTWNFRTMYSCKKYNFWKFHIRNCNIRNVRFFWSI